MKHYLFLKICMLGIAFILTQNIHAQTTLIPDANFEQALINLSLDTLLDGQVLTSNVNTVQSINVDNMNISDLTGIQDFDSLSHFSCKQNILTTIDVTQNSVLYFLDCRLNSLSAINLSQNSLLLTIYCSDNSISTLDFSQNALLKNIDCSNNPLVGLSLTQNPDLYRLQCENNGLANLDLTLNPQLTILECNNNQLTSLDLSQNFDVVTLKCNNNQLISIDFGTTADMSILECANNLLTELETGNMILLEVVQCDNNQIVQLDLVSNCLQGVNCNNNQIEYLDMSLSTTMTQLHCSDNLPLQYIDLRNNLINVVSSVFALNNPNLSCIIVDDSTYNHGPNWQYDTLITQVVETEAACNISLGISGQDHLTQSIIYPNPTSNYFSIKSPKPVTHIKVYSLNGSLVRSFPYQEMYSIEELSKGVYSIKLEYQKGSEVKLLFIE